MPGWAAAPYSAATRRAVLVAKRGAHAGLVELLCTRMPDGVLPRGAVVTWIPGHPRRTARRPDGGQALARAVARHAGLVARPCLARSARGQRQSGAHAEARRSAGAALGLRAITSAPAIVVLVDDVRTTGATLDHAGALLRARGSRLVLAIVACQAPGR